MNKIPIVFAFDNNYSLPASIAISSLLHTANEDTFYDIYVLYDTLKSDIVNKMNDMVFKYPNAKINWIKIDPKKFKNFPNNASWPIVVYYRLLIHDLIPKYDKIIWSDVDVLFKKDLAQIYNLDIRDNYWAGVIAEKNSETDGFHKRFEENKNEFIFMSGFMVINAKKMREDNMTQKFFDTIKKFDKRLKMFDLEVLILSCDKIAFVPFEYCVLENIYEDIKTAKEYPWLSKVYSYKELENAVNNPIIIHYAGKNPKIWDRPLDQIPDYY